MKNKLITNFAINIDENTIKQFNSCISKDYVISASLMPDAHSGYVAPIGAVIKTKNYIVPSWVGYDIGCGMIAIKLNSKDNDLKKLVKDKSKEIYKLVNKTIPLGLGEYNQKENITKKTIQELDKIINKFQKGEWDTKAINIVKNESLKNLGTLGSGNHFIEFSQTDDDNLWLVIHSGSRKIGHKLAELYMKKASNNNLKFEETYPLEVNSKQGKEYVNVLDYCLEFALLNRLEMAYKIHSLLEKYFNIQIEFELWTNKNHNHAIKEQEYYIHRKGATPAKIGERGVIPGNMRDGSFLVEGLGNKEYLESSSHGAGRILSRKQAKNKISMLEFKNSMRGIVGTIKQETLDEAPAAYKNIFEVMAAQDKSVKIIKHLKPIINIKG